MSTEQAVHHSTQDYVLSIDNGTQSVRAMLFDISGNLHGLSRIEIEPYVSAQPGWAEQEADYYWQAVGQACQQLWQQVSIDKHRFKASASPLSAALLCMWISKGEPYVQPWCGWISVWPMSAHRYRIRGAACLNWWGRPVLLTTFALKRKSIGSLSISQRYMPALIKYCFCRAI